MNGDPRPADQRGFAAAGIAAGAARRAPCAVRLAACGLRLATTYLSEHAGTFPQGFVPAHPTQLALLAITVFEAFMDAAERQSERAAFDQRINSAVTQIKRDRA